VRRFLVVDDDEDVLFLLRAILESLGQTVQSTSDLELARHTLRGGDVDALIVDVSMPDLNGPDFVTELRREGIEPPHVYLLSALPPDDVRRMAEDLGVGGIAKPFTSSKLQVALAEVLDTV
jgi:CheY-like chemotaxis protein